MKKNIKRKKNAFGNSPERSADELSIEGTSFVTLIDGVNHVDVRFDNKRNSVE